MNLPGPLVTPEWLNKNLGDPDLVLLESILKPRDPSASEIPGTRVFDIDHISDPNSSLPHMMPSPELFAERVQELGVSPNSQVVVYDRQGIYSSPRVWFMFRAMGFDNLAVLDGGLPAWLEKGFTTLPQMTPSTRPAGQFQAAPRVKTFCDAESVARAITTREIAVLDARSAGRFAGREAEPRPGLRSGHIPNSINLPFTEVLNGNRMKPEHELQALFTARVQARKQLILSCGSGVTACIIGLAAHVAGYDDLSIYDGSWTEWANR